MAKPQANRLVVCVNNDGYSASLELRKIYVALRDVNAEKHGLLRIIDESGDDYLIFIPRHSFVRSHCPRPSRRRSWRRLECREAR